MAKPVVKSSNAEMEERITALFGLAVEGRTRQEILRHASATWGVTKRQAETYYSRVSDRLMEVGASRRDEEFGRAVAQLCDLYSKTFKARNWMVALMTRQELSKLLALHPAKRKEVNVLFSSPDFVAFIDCVLDLLSPYPEALDAVLGGMRAKFPALAAAEPEPITVEAVEADETEEGEER